MMRRRRRRRSRGRQKRCGGIVGKGEKAVVHERVTGGDARCTALLSTPLIELHPGTAHGTCIASQHRCAWYTCW
jgi:hypothetical protein